MLLIPSPPQPHREDVEESGYLASVSDLMVGLLFVFIIMVVILSQRIAEGGKPVKDPLASAVEAIGEKVRLAGVPVKIDPATGVISLPSDTLFSIGSAELNQNGQKALSNAHSALTSILPCYIYSERNRRSNCPSNQSGVEIETVFVEGHTDSKPLQRGIYTNWHLGLDRARAVYDVLSVGEVVRYKNERGLDIVGISSYADKRPKSTIDNAENRRVELRFVLAFKPETNQASTSSKVVEDIQHSVVKQ